MQTRLVGDNKELPNGGNTGQPGPGWAPSDELSQQLIQFNINTIVYTVMQAIEAPEHQLEY